VLGSVAAHSPTGSEKLKRRILTLVDLLLRPPLAGQATNRPRLRRIVASPSPYLIFYQATDDEIIVHGVRHGARRPGSMPDTV
jgi:plasmid stabilization system protein ParE